MEKFEKQRNTWYFCHHEEKLSTEEAQAGLDAWFSCSSQEQNGPPPAFAPPTQGPRTPRTLMPRRLRLTWLDFKHLRGLRRVASEHFTLSFGTIQGRTVSGGACIVSKKSASRAVDRAAIKRRARPLLVDVLSGQKSPLIVVVTAKKGAGTLTPKAFRAELHALLQKLAER